MPTPPPDPLDDLLQAWQPELEADPHLTRHVLNRIAADERPAEAFFRPRRFFWRYAAIGGAAAGLALLAVAWLARPAASPPRGLLGAYRLAIDPVARAEADQMTRLPRAATPSLVEMLAWMQKRFALTQDQFVALAALDARYGPQFEALYRDLVTLEERYGRFEVQRQETDLIDFIALYELLQQRAAVALAAHSTSEQFVDAVLAILDPTQRQRYLTLLDPPPAPDEV